MHRSLKRDSRRKRHTCSEHTPQDQGSCIIVRRPRCPGATTTTYAQPEMRTMLTTRTRGEGTRVGGGFRVESTGVSCEAEHVVWIGGWMDGWVAHRGCVVAKNCSREPHSRAIESEEKVRSVAEPRVLCCGWWDCTSPVRAVHAANDPTACPRCSPFLSVPTT